VSVTDEAEHSRTEARERAIEAAAGACRNDGKALAALGIFLWAVADGYNIASAERAFLDAVLAAGGDWVATKTAIAELIRHRSDLSSGRDDELV
jgi:hypothetical protein